MWFVTGLGKTNEVHLIKFPGDVDKQPSESASVEQSVSINESSVTDGINTILSNSMNNENCIMQENIKNIEDIHARVDNVSPQNTLTDPNQTGMFLCSIWLRLFNSYLILMFRSML